MDNKEQVHTEDSSSDKDKEILYWKEVAKSLEASVANNIKSLIQKDKEIEALRGSMPVIDAIKGYADKNTLALQANLDKCTSENELWEKEVERLQDEIRNYWEKVSVHHDITGAPESVEQSLRREIERLKEELKKKQ